MDALFADLTDPGIVISVVGLDSHLPGRQGNHWQPALLQRHGAQGNGDLLPRGKQHIQFAPGRMGVDLVGFFDQVIRRVALGGKHDDYIIACFICISDNICHMVYALCIGHGRTAEFLHNQTHSCSLLFLLYSRKKSCCSIVRRPLIPVHKVLRTPAALPHTAATFPAAFSA